MSNNYFAGATGVIYTFTVIPKNKVAKSSYLQLYLPKQVQITDIQAMQMNCPSLGVSGFSNSYVLCSYDSNQQAIIIKYGFYNSDSYDNPPILIF